MSDFPTCKGVLVCADGRTIAVDECNWAEWYVLARELNYSKRRVFRLAEEVACSIPEPAHPVLVYIERPMANYDAHGRKRKIYTGDLAPERQSEDK